MQKFSVGSEDVFRITWGAPMVGSEEQIKFLSLKKLYIVENRIFLTNF